MIPDRIWRLIETIPKGQIESKTKADILALGRTPNPVCFAKIIKRCRLHNKASRMVIELLECVLDDITKNNKLLDYDTVIELATQEVLREGKVQ